MRVTLTFAGFMYMSQFAGPPPFLVMLGITALAGIALTADLREAFGGLQNEGKGK